VNRTTFVLRTPVFALGTARRVNRTTFVLRTPVFALGTARRAHGFGLAVGSATAGDSEEAGKGAGSAGAAAGAAGGGGRSGPLMPHPHSKAPQSRIANARKIDAFRRGRVTARSAAADGVVAGRQSIARKGAANSRNIGAES
jgi:hypothetical protein